MDIDRRGLKVKVIGHGQANAVGLTWIEGTFSHYYDCVQCATKQQIVKVTSPKEKLRKFKFNKNVSTKNTYAQADSESQMETWLELEV